MTSSGEHWFIPALTGFMIGRMLGHRDYYGAPYYGGGWGGWHGPYRDRPDRGGWSGGDNRQGYGAPATRGPTTAETLSRGGFGYSGAARSSWGG